MPTIHSTAASIFEPIHSIVLRVRPIFATGDGAGSGTGTVDAIWKLYPLTCEDVQNPPARTSANTPNRVERGKGTSSATPTVAGMAAFCLSHHRREKALAKRYGHPRYVPLAFAHILRNGAFRQPSDGLNTQRMGVGILDAEKLLAAPLPAKSQLQNWPKKPHPWLGDVVVGFFKIVNRRSVRGPRTAPDADGQRFSGKLAYHLFYRPALRTMIHPAAAAAPPRSPAHPADTEALFDGHRPPPLRSL